LPVRGDPAEIIDIIRAISEKQLIIALAELCVTYGITNRRFGNMNTGYTYIGSKILFIVIWPSLFFQALSF